MVLCIANSLNDGRRRIALITEYRATCAFAYSVATARDSGNDGPPFHGFVPDDVTKTNGRKSVVRGVESIKRRGGVPDPVADDASVVALVTG